MAGKAPRVGEVRRGRARDYGLAPGTFTPGPLNGITDVAGVAVGHTSRIEGDSIRTGVTVILPHAFNPHAVRCPAGIAVANGYGKFTGALQVQELGEIETPIALTNTLSAHDVASGLIGWTLRQPGNEDVFSVNPVVGETNDKWVNDIRARVIGAGDVEAAIAAARPGPVDEGSVGAGVGVRCFGWKGGIGTSSRVLPWAAGGFTIGVLVQTNYTGAPLVSGRRQPVGPTGPDAAAAGRNGAASESGGSVIVVIATDAPLAAHDLSRLASRSFLGLARTGSSIDHDSGEFSIAFSTAQKMLRDRDAPTSTLCPMVFKAETYSALFQAVVEATEEAVYNAMLAATSVTSRIGTLHRAPLSFFTESKGSE